MKNIRNYSKKIGSSKRILFLLFLLILSSVTIFIPLLPYNVGQNLLDLSIGFNREDINNAFNNMGERGKELHFYVSLILDTIFPLIYVSFHLGIYHYSNYKNNLIYLVPLVTGSFDLMENIQCALIMNVPTINLVSDEQIFLASSTNQIKWVLVLLMITIAIFPVFKKNYKKIKKSFLRRYLFFFNKEKFTYKINNIKLHLDIKDSIDRQIYFDGTYEEKQINFLRDSISKYRISRFIDIGANLGIYSISIAKAFPDLDITSFEPHEGAYKRFIKNIDLNKVNKNISPYQLALSNISGKDLLSSEKRFGVHQSGGAHISANGGIPIDKIRGDELLKFNKDLIAIKLDVEGYEIAVLNGIAELLVNNKIFLQIEIFDSNFAKVIKILETHRFKLINEENFSHANSSLKDYFFINF